MRKCVFKIVLYFIGLPPFTVAFHKDYYCDKAMKIAEEKAKHFHAWRWAVFTDENDLVASNAHGEDLKFIK